MSSASLIDQVLAVHPLVSVDRWSDLDGDETISFIPANDDGVSVTVYLRSGDTVQIEAVSFFADLHSLPAPERLEAAARITLAFAEHGYLRVRLLGERLRYLLGGDDNPYVAGPADGYWGVDEYAERFGSDIVERVGPWLGTRTGNSD